MNDPKALTPDTLVMVRLHSRSPMGGNVKLADLRELHWRTPAGEVLNARMPRARLCARVWCDALVTGALHLECAQHAPRTHDVPVQIVQLDNPELFEQLAALAG